MTTRQIESPDGRELQRTSCPECGYQIASAVWCHDPSCCHQSPEIFIDGLLAAEAVRGIPVFAIRLPHPLPPYSDDIPVRIWRAGNLAPVFAGRLGDAYSVLCGWDAKNGPDIYGTERTLADNLRNVLSLILTTEGDLS